MLSADPESVPSAAPLLIDMDGDEESPPAIFVTMPCYRDPECGPTIHDLFAKAKLPDRVTVGVVWQIDEDEDGPSCLSHPILQERSFQVTAPSLSVAMICICRLGCCFN